MNTLTARLRGGTRRIEHASALDGVASALQPLAARLTRSDRVKALLSGAPIGHRLHPLLTDVPIGLWTSAGVLDVVGGRSSRRAARRLTGLGIVAAVPTAMTGLSDWEDTNGRARRVGVAHAAANSLALLLQVASWSARRKGHTLRGKVLGGLGLGAVTVGGYLGGHLVYTQSVGVDPQVPLVGLDTWRFAARIDDLIDGVPFGVEVDGARVVLVRNGAGVHALAATCSHAGGPLDKGSVEDGLIQCPWHRSRFALDDGSVARGPAAAPQPRYHVRVRAGIVEIRRAAQVAAPGEPVTLS